MKKLIGVGSQATFLTLKLGNRVIACFGNARLVRTPEGRHELIGGTASDCTDAREWCALFAPEVVFSPAPRRSRTLILAI